MAFRKSDIQCVRETADKGKCSTSNSPNYFQNRRERTKRRTTNHTFTAFFEPHIRHLFVTNAPAVCSGLSNEDASVEASNQSIADENLTHVSTTFPIQSTSIHGETESRIWSQWGTDQPAASIRVCSFLLLLLTKGLQNSVKSPLNLSQLR